VWGAGFGIRGKRRVMTRNEVVGREADTSKTPPQRRRRILARGQNRRPWSLMFKGTGKSEVVDWLGKEEMSVWKRREVGATKKKESRGQKSGEGRQAQIFTAVRPVQTTISLSPNPRASFGNRPGVEIASTHLGPATMT
jgi:hypothetical protein